MGPQRGMWVVLKCGWRGNRPLELRSFKDPHGGGPSRNWGGGSAHIGDLALLPRVLSAGGAALFLYFPRQRRCPPVNPWKPLAHAETTPITTPQRATRRGVIVLPYWRRPWRTSGFCDLRPSTGDSSERGPCDSPE